MVLLVQKTFHEVPMTFRVSCGNPESRQGMVSGDFEEWKFDRERGWLQSCSLFLDRKTLLRLTRNLL